MKSRNPLAFRQEQACLAGLFSKRFAVRSQGFMVLVVKMRRNGVPLWTAAFRNPSPWRQSGASMYLLPLFLTRAALIHNFEREIKCRKLQNSAPHLSCPLQSQAAWLNRTSRFKALQQALQSVRSRVKRLAAAALTLQPVRSLAASQARPQQPTKTHSARRLSARSHTDANVALPLWGGAAFCVST